jgi:hypothetical protein
MAIHRLNYIEQIRREDTLLNGCGSACFLIEAERSLIKTGRENHNLNIWAFVAQASDEGYDIHRGQFRIDQKHMGVKGFAEEERIVTVGGLPDHFYIGLFVEKYPKCLT